VSTVEFYTSFSMLTVTRRDVRYAAGLNYVSTFQICLYDAKRLVD